MAPSPTAEATRLIEPWRHITRREHARHGGFQIVRLAIELPVVGQRPVFAKVGPGNKIILFVADDAHPFRPFSIRYRAETEKQKARLDGPFLTGLAVLERDRLQHVIAMQRDDLGFGHDLDVERVLDAVDKIFRDAVVQALCAHNDDHLTSVGRGAVRLAPKNCRSPR